MTFVRNNYRDGLVYAGLLALIGGCALVAVPLGLIVGGLCALALAFLSGAS